MLKSGFDWGESQPTTPLWVKENHHSRELTRYVSSIELMIMEIRQLEALVGIAEHGTFSGAAEALGTVPVSYTHLTLPTKRIV